MSLHYNFPRSILILSSLVYLGLSMIFSLQGLFNSCYFYTRQQRFLPIRSEVGWTHRVDQDTAVAKRKISTPLFGIELRSSSHYFIGELCPLTVQLCGL
jgi:hypothetical protein